MEQTINEFLSYLRDHVWRIALAAIFLLGVSFLCSRLCTHKRKIWEPFIASCIAVLGVVATVLAFVPKVDVEQSSEILSNSDESESQSGDSDSISSAAQTDFENTDLSESEESGILQLIIDNYEIFEDGYYYEYPDPKDSNTICFIDFDEGIHGQFHYTRALTNSEKANWAHGGNLFDANGNEIAEEGNYPSFWATEDGCFAMEFPQNLPSGNYVYRMHQIIDGKELMAEIEFSI